MYHDVFANFDASGVATTRAAALAAASPDAVVAKLVDEVAKPVDADAGAGPVTDAAVADTVHPMGAVDPRDIAFQVLDAEARDDGERKFVAGVRKLSFDGTPVPWTVRGPSLQAAIAMTGAEPADDDARDRFAALLSRATHLLTPALGRGSNRRMRRGGAETFIGKVRTKLDELPFGSPIPRWGESQRVSWPGMAVMLGLPLPTLLRSVQARWEVQDRLGDGRLVLGQPFRQAGSWRADVKPARDRLIAVIDGHAAPGRTRPVAVAGVGRGRILMDPLLDEAEVTDQRIRDALWSDAHVRSTLARMIAVVGTRRLGEKAPLVRPLLTFADLMAAGVRSAEAAFRERNDDAGDKAVTKAGQDEAAFLRRVMRVNGWNGDDDVESALLGKDGPDAIARGCTQNLRSDRNYLAAMDRWKAVAISMVAARKEGVTFAERVDRGIRKLGMSSRSFSFRHDIPYDSLLRWQHGKGMPTSHQLHYVYRMEKAFGEARGELVALLGVVRGGRNDTPRKTVRLADGRTVELKRYLRSCRRMRSTGARRGWPKPWARRTGATTAP